MGEKENHALARRYWETWVPQDLNALGEFLADDCVQEFPQSGERIRGKDNILAILESYPGLPKATIKRTTCGNKLAVGELQLDYGHKVYDCISIIEIKGEKVVHEVQYFTEPFEAPAWRSQWVERM